jgi:glycosyltransferase involved in cell wall biosynthesis
LIGTEQSLRIGIDATLVRPDRLSGVERYAVSLLRALANLVPNDLVLFTQPDPPPDLASLPVEQWRAPRLLAAGRVVLDQLWIPGAALWARVDLLHTLAFPTPLLWRGRSVMTVHDATRWLFPETISVGMRYYYGPLYSQALRRAEAVLTVSRAAREDLARVTKLPVDRFHVTPNGVDRRFFEARATEGPRAPYLLSVGTLEPRKNLLTLLDAFSLLRREGRDLELVIVGRRGWSPSLPLGDLSPYVNLTGSLPDRELPTLYAGAACFVMPSFYEGFGLPLAEAMAAGTPAVASDIGALREVGGETARYADPRSAESFAAAIRAALDEKDRTRELAAAARDRAARFTWEACAEATLAVYREAVGGRRRSPPRV